MKEKHLTNFILSRTFFLIASYQNLKNDVILINLESFFQERESSQLHLSQFSQRNSLMAETIKNQQNSYKQIAEFGNKLLNLENWKRLSCRGFFS